MSKTLNDIPFYFCLTDLGCIENSAYDIVDHGKVIYEEIAKHTS